MNNPNRKEASILNRIMRALDAFSEIHNNEVAPLLTRHNSDLAQVKEDVQVLFDLVEMNNSVLIRAMATGVLDEGGEQCAKEIVRLQDEYLAIQAIFGFFKGI